MGLSDHSLILKNDGTLWSCGYNGNRYENITTGSKVVLQQSFHEDREDFIENNHIEFQNNQYGSNLFKDIIIIEGSTNEKIGLIHDGYGLDKLVTDSDAEVRKECCG